MAKRGVIVDHATVHRWALKILPVLAAVFRRRKRPVGSSWRVDETYIKIGGQWKYLYRAVDKLGHTVDFLLTAKRDVAAARRFFERAIDRHDVPESITIDKSGANTAAVKGLVGNSGVAIELRQSKYLNNLVEQDHRAIKRIVRPMLGFKDFDCARRLIAGIETMHMVKKGSSTAPKAKPCPPLTSSTHSPSDLQTRYRASLGPTSLLRHNRRQCGRSRMTSSGCARWARLSLGGCITKSIQWAPMKTSTLPPVRVEPALRAEVEALLDEGESLSDFVAGCVRDGVAWRRTQDAFVARAHGAIERALGDGGGLTPDEILDRLNAQLQAARARVGGAVPTAGRVQPA